LASYITLSVIAKAVLHSPQALQQQQQQVTPGNKLQSGSAIKCLTQYAPLAAATVLATAALVMLQQQYCATTLGVAADQMGRF
jgi:hypothetical protein